MTAEPKTPQEDIPTVNPEVIPDQSSLVQPEASEPARQIVPETLKLIEAIRIKAQSEAQKAGDFARDSYLDAVRKAREDIETRNIFEPARLEEAMKQLQMEVEKDWDAVAKQVSDLGDRLNEAARAAWEALTAPPAKKE